MSETQKPLDLIINKPLFNLITKKVMDTQKDSGDGRTFTYTEIVESYEKDQQIRVLGRHFSLDKVFCNARGNCNTCNGKGYSFINIPKAKYPNPNPYLIDEETLPKDLSPEEQKRWTEEQKDVKTWRVLQPCMCAVKRTHAKHPEVLSNALHNIWLTLDYVIEPRKEEIEKKEEI